jgi:hypothetical protein
VVELFDDIYYDENEEELEVVDVMINKAVEFSEIFPFGEEAQIMCKLRREYHDLIEVIREECDKFRL